jgi:recombination protein RecA
VLARKIQPASWLLGAAQREEKDGWRFSELAGNIIELSGQGATATATLALRLVVEAQGLGEPAAWVTVKGRCFYPPDAEANGVDLDALAVVRVPEVHEVGKAADYLVRSGAFGVVVLDLGAEERLPERQLTRLLGLARKHGTAVLCLTAKPEAVPSLGGLISMRGSVKLARLGPGEYACELVAVKDKRRPPGWRHKEVWGAPPGLR